MEDEKREAKILFYTRLTCLFSAAILGIVIAAAVRIVPDVIRVTRHVESSLEKLDGVAARVNEWSNANGGLDLSKLSDAAENLNALAGGLKELDVSRLNNALKRLDGLEKIDFERLDEILSALEGVDLNHLGEMIGKLDSVIEPLSRFAGVFR